MTCTIGWFTTGRDKEAVSLLETILKGIQTGDINGVISYIFINRAQGEGICSDRIMDLGIEWKIPVIALSSARFEPELRREGRGNAAMLAEWRNRYHKEVLLRLKGFDTDFAVLAGYMLIVSPAVCHRLNLINLHPALPGGPSGAWQDVIWELIATGAAESGVTIHMVTPELDQGPPVTYCSYSIRNASFSDLWQEMEEKLSTMPLGMLRCKEGEGNPLFQRIRREGVKREHPLLFETIRLLSSGRIRIENHKTYCDSQECTGGVCLTEHVERIITAIPGPQRSGPSCCHFFQARNENDMFCTKDETSRH